MAVYDWNTTVNNATWSTLSNWRVGGVQPASLPTSTDDVRIILDIAATTTVVPATTINARSISIGDTSPVSNQWSLSASGQAQSTGTTWALPAAGGTIDVPNAGSTPFALSRSTLWMNVGGGSAGGLTKTGPGTLSLLGGNTNTFSGNFSVNAGYITIGNGTTSTVTMGSGSTVLANGVYIGAYSGVATVWANDIVVAASSSAFLFYNSPGTVSQITFSGAVSIPSGSTLTGYHPSAGTVIIGGVISGAGTLTNDGTVAGTLRLNAANTFTGYVQNASGTLALNNTNAIQDALLDTDNLLGTVTFLSNSAIGGLIGTTAFTLPAGTTQIGGVGVAVTATYTGAIGGTTQAILKVNSGTQTLGGVSTRTTGTTQINAGAIELTNGNGLYGPTGSGATSTQGGSLWLTGNITTPSTAPLTLQANGTGTSSGLRSVSGSNTYAGTVTFSSLVPGNPVSVYADEGATLTLSNTITLTSPSVFSGPGTIVVSGALASTGTVTKSDAGLLRITGASTKTAGAWTLNGGETRLETANALGAAASSIAVATVAAGAKLYVVGTITIPANKTVSALAGTLGATSTGGGTWAGAVVVSATGATIENNTAGAFTVSGGITPASSGFTLTYAGTSNITQSGVISGALSVTKNGTGTTTFSAANTYSGTTTLAAGTANAGITENAGTNGPFGSANTAGSLLMTGGTLQYSASNTRDYSNRLATTGSQQWRIDTNGQSVSFGTVLQNSFGTSSLTKLGAGTLTLTGANTFSGNIVVSAGTLSATTSTQAFGANNTGRIISVAPGGTLSVGVDLISLSNLTVNLAGTGDSGTSGALVVAHPSGSTSLNATLTDAAVIRVSSAGTGSSFAGTVNNAGFDLTLAVATGATATILSTISGAGRLIAGTLGNTATVQMASVQSYTGSTDLAFASILMAAGSSLGSGSYAGNISIASGLTFTHAGLTQTISGIISGAGALTKGNTTTLTLSGANTYTGKTTVTAGTLSFNSIGNVNGGASALGNPSSVANGTISVGSTTNTATIAYTGGPASTDRVIDLAGSSGGATISNTGSGLLTFTSDLTATVSGAKTLTASGTAPITFAGVIVNSAQSTGLSVSSSSTVKLTAANTYTGTTSISGTGTLDVSAGDNRISPLSPLNASNGTLFLGSANQTFANITISSGANKSFTGSGLLTATGQLSDASFAGTCTIVCPISVAGSITKTGASTLFVNSTASIGALTVSSGAVTFASSLTSGAGSITNSTVTFSGANTLSGVTWNFGGTSQATTINYNGSNNFDGLTALSVGSGTTTFTGTGASVTLAQNWLLSAGALVLTLPTAGSSLTLSGEISGASSGLTLGVAATTVGSSSVLYATNTGNTFSGNVTVRNGALYVTDVRQLGSGTKTISVAASGTGAASLVLDGLAGNITLPSTLSFSTSSGTGVSPQPTYFGVVNVAGDNIIQGTVSMTGGGGDSYFTVTGGTLTIAGNVSASTTTRVMQLGGTGSGTVSGNIAATNAPAVRVSGSSAWTLSGTNAYTGGTTTADTATIVAGSTTALGVGNVTLGAGTSIKTLTAGGQNGKLTITGTFNNSAGATIYIGG